MLNGHIRADVLSQKVFGSAFSVGKIYIVLDVLEEFDLIKTFWYGDEADVEIKKTKSKVSLDTSRILLTLNKMKEVAKDE